MVSYRVSRGTCRDYEIEVEVGTDNHEEDRVTGHGKVSLIKPQKIKLTLRRQRQAELFIKPAWSASYVPGQPRLHSEILSQKYTN